MVEEGYDAQSGASSPMLEREYDAQSGASLLYSLGEMGITRRRVVPVLP